MNSAKWIFSYLGMLKAAWIPVTVNTEFIKDPLIYNIRMPESRFLLLDSRLVANYSAVKDSLPLIENVILIGDENHLTVNFKDMQTLKFYHFQAKI